MSEITPALSGSPTSEDPRFEQPTPAPLFELGQQSTVDQPSASASEQLAELLSGLLKQPAPAARGSHAPRPSWDPRKLLLCVPEDNRESIARSMAENGYQVFVAQDTRQAVDRMRENQLDVVLLDPRFDPTEQGSVFVSREVNILRPTQRRSFLGFAFASPRTMDGHTILNVNAIININELDELPALIEHRLRDFNELYKEFNIALGVSAV